MKTILIFLLPYLLITSCSEPEEERITITFSKKWFEEKPKVIHLKKRKPIVGDKVLIIVNKEDEKENVTSNFIVLDSISSLALIDSVNLFKIRYGGYIGASETPSEILIYNDNKIIKSFEYSHELADKIIVSAFNKIVSEFQSSFLDSLLELNTSIEVKQSEYNFDDLKKGRSLLKYCQENGILYENGEVPYSPWIDMDGEFALSYLSKSYSDNGDSIKQMIANIIPNEKFRMTGSYYTFNTEDERLNFRVYCDKESYDKFISAKNDSTLTISNYKPLHSRLFVYCNKKTKIKLDKFIQSN